MVTYGEVCVLGGEPHHCMLHSVLYGLSAVAEFLACICFCCSILELQTASIVTLTI